MNIFSGIDSFKGTLSSVEIADILKAYYEDKQVNIKAFPISDGGEGFLEAIKSKYLLDFNYLKSFDALNKKITTKYILKDEKAYIELSEVSGINLIKENKKNPLKTTTYGLGIVIKDAIIKGAKNIVIGLGGSATNDGGAGMLQALGVKFYHKNKEIKNPLSGGCLNLVEEFNTIELEKLIKNVKFIIATDVNNQLLGLEGATHIYGRQKGANDKTILKLEENMSSYSEVVKRKFNKEYSLLAGAGAAGGVGFAALAFLKAELVNGIDYIIDELEIEEEIKKSDLVFVGEGKLDKQTLFGKAPYGIAKLAKKYHKKVIGIFAVKDESIKEINLIDEVYSIVPNIATLEESLVKTKESLIKLLDEVKI